MSRKQVVHFEKSILCVWLLIAVPRIHVLQRPASASASLCITSCPSFPWPYDWPISAAALFCSIVLVVNDPRMMTPKSTAPYPLESNSQNTKLHLCENTSHPPYVECFDFTF